MKPQEDKELEEFCKPDNIKKMKDKFYQKPQPQQSIKEIMESFDKFCPFEVAEWYGYNKGFLRKGFTDLDMREFVEKSLTKIYELGVDGGKKEARESFKKEILEKYEDWKGGTIEEFIKSIK